MKFDDCGKDRGINIWMGEKKSRRAPEATCSPEIAYSRYESYGERRRKSRGCRTLRAPLATKFNHIFTPHFQHSRVIETRTLFDN